MTKQIIKEINTKETLPLTSGFTQAGVYARRQYCADIHVCSPQELLWNPRLREAATTLAASVERQCIKTPSDKHLRQREARHSRSRKSGINLKTFRKRAEVKQK